MSKVSVWEFSQPGPNPQESTTVSNAQLGEWRAEPETISIRSPLFSVSLSRRETKTMENDLNLKRRTPPPNRSSLKPSSNFNNYPLWKDKLRENCYKRVREDRTRLLWKMRLPTAESLSHKDFIKSAFQNIVSDELKKIKDSSSNDSLKLSSPMTEADDKLWEYDGLHTAYQGECEDILIEMQRIFYEDLKAESTSKEPESHVETWEDQEDEYLAHAVYEHMQLNDQVQKETWCPICKQGKLQENRQLIYCTGCEFQLSKDDEVNLDTLRVRLADVHTEHFDQGCRLKPKFCIETIFGLTALYVVCENCNTLEVVI